MDVVVDWLLHCLVSQDQRLIRSWVTMRSQQVHPVRDHAHLQLRTFEDILHLINPLGSWQIWTYSLLSILQIFFASINVAITFMQITPDFACKLPFESNWTVQQTKNIRWSHHDPKIVYVTSAFWIKFVTKRLEIHKLRTYSICFESFLAPWYHMNIGKLQLSVEICGWSLWARCLFCLQGPSLQVLGQRLLRTDVQSSSARPKRQLLFELHRLGVQHNCQHGKHHRYSGTVRIGISPYGIRQVSKASVGKRR